MEGHTVLVTGARGFVGRHLVRRLAGLAGVTVRTASRSPAAGRESGTGEHHAVGAIDGNTDWSGALSGCRSVIHLAARVHVMHETSADPDAEFMRVNAEGSRRLAEQAAAAGVSRFVLISTLGVHGASSPEGMPFGPSSALAPHDAYTRSKALAEDAVRSACRAGGMEHVIVRPPMVYGRQAPGNFAVMCRVLRRRLPLPLASVRNRRSIVSVTNLTDLIARVLACREAGDRVVTVSDGEDLSTPELLVRAARAMGLGDPPLLPFPPAALRGMLALAGQRRTAERLLDSCQADISETCGLLGWRPPATVDESLEESLR
jgi:nucleoside-diphosphate-sugar epimerase